MHSSSIREYLYRHIPLSQAMQVEVERADDGGVVLSAPLSPNINHQGTGFGGSLSTLAVLAGWSFLYRHFAEQGARIVIQRSGTHYLAPVEETFEAHCDAPPAAEWTSFLRALKAKGRGRVALAVRIVSGGATKVEFDGDYVVTLKRGG